MDLNCLSENDISLRLAKQAASGKTPPFLEFPYQADFLRGEPKPAAVLIPMLRFSGEWHLLFTRRTDSLPEHSGQVAFPGGSTDAGDETPESTALRETHEEIGLNSKDVRLLGRLNSYITVTNYLVTPVVGAIPWPYPLKLAEEEVSRAFTIPLEWLADPINHEERFRLLPPPYKPVPVIYFREYDGEVLWGASARFTLGLIQALM